MKKLIISLLLLFATSSVYSKIVSVEIYSFDKLINVMNYKYSKSEIKECVGNNCETIYNFDEKYCTDILKINNEFELLTRMRVRCPRYESIKNINSYNIKLSSDPFFSEYTFNLEKIFSSADSKKNDNIINFEIFNFRVDLPPNNFLIPYEMHEIIKSIKIIVDDKNYVLSEEYEMQDSSKFIRQYIYQNHNISQIIEIKQDANSKIIYSSKHAYVYK
ncbi:hypothetical protein [Acinetobacter gerneri]|uniref:hypothetical protein n=1 Tax=Acinetobacter gerneri TaxID=202952 RepID=UPI0023F3EE03|nr:hypothetical protein [Acinetobacter gerneri]MCH4245802.1 hypothetical protein [Acinetobacter gerneri]